MVIASDVYCTKEKVIGITKKYWSQYGPFLMHPNCVQSPNPKLKCFRLATLLVYVKVDTEGDMLTSVDFSTSGECLAFGGSGGFVHLWGFSSEPRVNLRSTPIEMPPLGPQPETSMDEDQPFSTSAQLPYTEVGHRKILSKPVSANIPFPVIIKVCKARRLLLHEDRFSQIITREGDCTLEHF